MLKVQEVYRDKESFRAIEVDNNFIELPGELFSSLNDSGLAKNFAVRIKLSYFTILDFIVSRYFKNISHLLPKT